jgi:hypothetical protein
MVRQMIKKVERLPVKGKEIDHFISNLDEFCVNKKCFTSINWKDNNDIQKKREMYHKAWGQESRDYQVSHALNIKKRRQEMEENKNLKNQEKEIKYSQQMSKFEITKIA